MNRDTRRVRGLCHTWRCPGWVVLAGLTAGIGGCKHPAAVALPSRTQTQAPSTGRGPIWAVQLAWLPHGGGGLRIQYNSLSGAYSPTSAVFPTAEKTVLWRRCTWKLTSVNSAGRQNGGADLRLSGGAGMAVHQVTLTAIPPTEGRSAVGGPGPAASIIFDTDHAGANTSEGLIQVLSGGNTGDSRYRRAWLDGRSAEVLRGNVSYIYLRLSRRGRLFRAHPKVLYATVTYTTTFLPAPWSERTFAHLAARGIRYAEINMPWGQVEPAPGRFSFEWLDRTLANAAKAKVRLIPIFWYSVWPGSPPAWVTRYEVGSSGAASDVPAWWSRFNRRAYFNYVTTSIAHIRNNPGFGGAFLDFGWLDYMWGPGPGGGVNGYAAVDVRRFHRWLPSRYHSLAAFNRRFGTRYAAWNKVPAAKPGQPLFAVYQHFRNWSLIETYRQLTKRVRHETAAPLYYYWGGGYGGAGVAFNLPDTFFQLARRYHAIVCEDCADQTGLMVLFGSLARAYQVPLLEEWTPARNRLSAEITQFLGHYGFGMPHEVGMDFFLYHGGQEYRIGFPPYAHWLKILSQIHGSYPHPPVAVYISYRPVFTKPTALGPMQQQLALLWRRLHIAFTVVTDREIKAGVIRLAQFRAVLPLNGRQDPAIKAYAADGGKVLTRPDQLARYAAPYIRFTPAANGMEVVPTVDRAARIAWLTLCDAMDASAYRHGTVSIRWAALGLPAGRYRVIDAATGRSVAGTSTRGGFSAPFSIVPGELRLWKIGR